MLRTVKVSCCGAGARHKCRRTRRRRSRWRRRRRRRRRKRRGWRIVSYVLDKT